MFSRFEFIIALHYLRPKGAAGIIALFSLVGIILGVATLTITTSVMNGFRIELMSSITNVNGHISLYGKIDQEMVTRLKNYEYVTSVVPTIDSQAMISSKHNNAGTFVRGVEVNGFENIAQKITNGNFQNFHNGLLIGTRLAENLMLKVGDEVNIFSTQSVTTMIGNIPKMKTYTIVGIFELGMFEYDNVLTYMPIDMARKFFRYGEGSFNNVDIHIKDVENADVLAQEIEKSMHVSASSWKERGGYIEALETEKIVMFIILTMIILVASFNIISSLIMLVQSKKNAIAILRTIGATRGSIMRIFIICGSSVGILGTFFGLLLGLAFANNIETIKTFLENLSGAVLFNPLVYFFNKIPATIVIADIIKISVMSLALSFLATILPAINAARQDPAKILCGE